MQQVHPLFLFDQQKLKEKCFLQREAEELFLLPDCVHIFFVTADGKVSTFSEPSTLRIFKFKDSGEDPSFLQVGGWTHPLIPGQSPVLEAGNGAFMFPDVYEEDGKGASVGVVIADDSVFNLEGEAQAALAETLAQLTELKKSEKKVRELFLLLVLLLVNCKS